MDLTVLLITLALIVTIYVGYFILRLAKTHTEQKTARERLAFYKQYEPPKGQSAIDSRKEIEAMIDSDPDFKTLNRQQRRAMAVRVDTLMRKRGIAAKGYAG